MEKSLFFDSADGDRTYFSEDFAALYSVIFSGKNGVMQNYLDQLEAALGSGAVTVGTGAGWINGRLYVNDAQKSIPVPAGNRVDRVVLRLDMANRIITTALKQGTAGTPPTLQQDATIFELSLASFMIATDGALSDLIDERDNKELCGYVAISGGGSGGGPPSTPEVSSMQDTRTATTVQTYSLASGASTIEVYVESGYVRIRTDGQPATATTGEPLEEGFEAIWEVGTISVYYLSDSTITVVSRV